MWTNAKPCRTCFPKKRLVVPAFNTCFPKSLYMLHTRFAKINTIYLQCWKTLLEFRRLTCRSGFLEIRRTNFFDSKTHAISTRQRKFVKILRIEMENYSHHHDNGNVLNRTSMDIDLFNISILVDEI